MYIHQITQWPNFSWDQAKISEILADARYMQGRLLGRMDNLGFSMREEATLLALTQDVLKTSEIEGEKLDVNQVRSSLARRLGMDAGALMRIDRDVEGIVEVMVDATVGNNKPLSKKRLYHWHSVLFHSGGGLFQRMVVGQWRNETSGLMQVVSGPVGRQKVHFEAPTFDRLENEMARFIKWFNDDVNVDLVIKSAIAHLWFVTIHPFDDGNGRIARAIGDMLLARSESSTQRFYSISSQIQRERNDYYNVLEKTQKGSLDITEWLVWYLNCFKHAMLASEQTLNKVIEKSKFWSSHSNEAFNNRQRVMINMLFENFHGKLNSSKWAKITKCSQDTALRDINDLLERKILFKEEGGGRSTSYQLSGVTSS